MCNIVARFISIKGRPQKLFTSNHWNGSLRFVDQLVILTEGQLVKKSQPLPSSVYFSNSATWCNLASSSLSNLPSLPLVRVELDVQCSVVPPSSTHELPSTSTSTAPHTSTTFYSPFFMFPTVVSCLQN